MPQISRDFEVKGPLPSVWKALNDPNVLGACVPGCEQVSVISDVESRWKVKISVGVIARRIDAKAKVIQRREPNQLAIKIESVDGDINGEFHLDLSEKAQNATQVKFAANLDAKGPFQWIVNQVIKNQLDGFVNQFANCISSKV